MIVVRLLIDIFIVIGAFFALAGTLGLLKMPDTLCRMQASTCIPTLGKKARTGRRSPIGEIEFMPQSSILTSSLNPVPLCAN